MAPLPTLSIQLYSVRRQLAEDFQGTLARLAELGLTQVEPFDLVSDPAGLREALDRNGLTAPTAHTRLTTGLSLDEVLDAAGTVGVGTVIDPMIDPERWNSADGVRGVAEELSAASATAAERGLRIGYHNHAFEWENTVDGRPALETFAELLDPAVVLELDTYWAAVGGQDVPAAIHRLGDRVRFLHLKDGPISKNNLEQLPLGAGAMPVDRIVDAATSLEIPVLEFDDYDGDIFDGVRRSIAFARGLA
jgi:sugar phosphate isomerase/epimerase